MYLLHFNFMFLDNFVGGGLTEGRGVLETAIKEGEEEAGLEPHLCKNILPTGTISYLHQSDRGIHPLTEFIFDLELPETWLPANKDGEVDEWILCPVNKIFDVLFSKVRNNSLFKIFMILARPKRSLAVFSNFYLF